MENIILKTQETLKFSKVLLAWNFSRLLTPLSEDLAALLASKVWFTPMRYRGSYKGPHSPIKPFKKPLCSFPGIIVYHYIPENPLPGSVVLVHGWGGSSHQFDKLIENLLESRRAVVCFDFPAHGRSKGFSTDLWEMSEILNEVLSSLSGPVDLVCHSFGLLVAGQVLKHPAAHINRMVSISSPRSFKFLIDQFLHKTRMKRNIEEPLIKHIQKRVMNKIDVRNEIDLDAKFFKYNWLIIHDESDREIPITEFEELKKLSPTAKAITTKGLGHNKILHSEVVIQDVINFLSTDCFLRQAVD